MTDSINQWPYPLINDMYEENPLKWHETNQDIFYDQLECLPSAMMGEGCFMNGTTILKHFSIWNTSSIDMNHYFNIQ